jgi:hypothetical protein
LESENMSDRVKIHVEQTFSGELSKEDLQKAGKACEISVLCGLKKEGYVLPWWVDAELDEYFGRWTLRRIAAMVRKIFIH